MRPIGSAVVDRTRDLMRQLVDIKPSLLERLRKIEAWRRIVLGIGAAVGVGVVRVALNAVLDDNILAYPFAFFYLATMLMGIVFGAAAGMATGITSLFVVAYLFLVPMGSDRPHEGIQLIELSAFMLFTALSSWLISIMHNAIDRLKESEELRALLFREFRHRSRNDLNGLYGLLMLRARRCTTEEAKQHLESAAHHTLTLAKVYTRLERHHLVSGDVMIETREYLEGLVSDIRGAHGLDNKGITVTTSIVEHGLQFERAITLGLILNEAMMNALKHAFGSGPGHIHVELVRGGDDLYLEVSDNGRGMLKPDQSVRKPGTGLGTRILSGLATQLGGGLTQTCPGMDGMGTMLRVRFPVAQPGTGGAVSAR